MSNEQVIKDQLIVDPSGFLQVNGSKAPFKFDPKRGIIQWLERDKRKGQGPVEVSIRDLGRLEQQPG